MDILGIGPLELLMILILALLVFGPDKLPEIGARLGKGMRQLRQATRSFTQEVEQTRQALDPDQAISSALKEIGGVAKGAAALAEASRNPGLAIRDSVVRELKAQPVSEEVLSPADASQTEGGTPASPTGAAETATAAQPPQVSTVTPLIAPTPEARAEDSSPADAQPAAGS